MSALYAAVAAIVLPRLRNCREGRGGGTLLTCDHALARLCGQEGVPCVTGRELLA